MSIVTKENNPELYNALFEEETNEVEIMSEEIKKLLDLLEYCVEKNEYLEVSNMKEWKPLLNYITNLQKENEELLKKLENVSLDEANIRADILLEQQDYKSRNEKAIEYIKERKDLNWYADGVFMYELLNILEGGD